MEKHQESGSQRENTDGKHRQKTHREKTQTENTQRENTDRKHRQKTHREKTQTENTERKHRQKTHRQKTETRRQKHREKHRQKYYTILQSTYYTILFHTTQHHTLRLCTTKYYAALHVRAGNRAQDLLLPRLTPYPRGKFSGTTIFKRL